MLHTRKWARGAAALTMVILGNAARAAPAADLDHLEEIIVTARKTEESLQKVPISVTAVTGEELAKRSLPNLSAIGQSTPNFTFGQQLQGGASAGVVYIRGVGQADTYATYDPAVGIYIDGVYLGRMQANDLDMMDIARVEILRGPQGTLFGKNTSGGAVSIITTQPDASANGLSGKTELIGGNFHRFDAMASVNIPLVTDRAALQAAVSRRSEDGYGRRTDGESQGSTNRDSGRVALLLKPADNLSALFALDGTSYHETNSVLKLLAIDTTVGPVAAINAFTPLPYDNRWLSTSDFVNNGTGPNLSGGRLWGGSLTLNYKTGWGNLKSISAYRHNDVENDQDPDSSPVRYIDEFQAVKQHQFSQELQATGAALEDRLNWVMGLYYFTEDVYSNTSYPLLVPLFGYAASFTERFFIKNKSYAGYGQDNYQLTDKLKFTAGIRYTHDDKQVERLHLTYPDDLNLQPPTTKTLSYNDISPRVGFDYQWTPSIMTYVSASKGYKAGGFNGRGGTVADFNSFRPEVVKTYELGLRSDLFDRRVRFNATVFYSDYRDLQVQINGSQNINGLIEPFNFVTNIPKSRVVGSELELTVVPTSGLTLSAGLGLIDAKYQELPTDLPFVAANLIHLNTRFVDTPKVSFTPAAEYTTPISDAFRVTGRVDYSYKSSIQYWVSGSPYLLQGSYGLLNARLTFDHDPSGLSFSLFATNLTDKHYFVGGFDDLTVPNPGLGFVLAQYGRPREYGASVRWHF